jgi:hypothetical protein
MHLLSLMTYKQILYKWTHKSADRSPNRTTTNVGFRPPDGFFQLGIKSHPASTTVAAHQRAICFLWKWDLPPCLVQLFETGREDVRNRSQKPKVRTAAERRPPAGPPESIPAGPPSAVVVRLRGDPSQQRGKRETKQKLYVSLCP